MTLDQTWKGSAFTVERKDSKAPGTVVLRLSGPLTARDVYGVLSPDAMRGLLDSQPAQGDVPHVLNILDLSGVPYVDSMGIGMIVREYVRCQGKGVRLIAAGAGPRVLQVLKLTKIDTVLPLAASVEEAEMTALA